MRIRNRLEPDTLVHRRADGPSLRPSTACYIHPDWVAIPETEGVSLRDSGDGMKDKGDWRHLKDFNFCSCGTGLHADMGIGLTLTRHLRPLPCNQLLTIRLTSRTKKEYPGHLNVLP